MEWCSTIGSGSNNRTLWRTFRAMERGTKIKDHTESIRIALQPTPKEFADQAARRFFPKHDHPPTEPPSGEEKETDGITTPFTKAELIAAIDEAKRRSTPGHDGIPYELYKNLEGEAIGALLDALNEVWISGKVPMDWKHSIVVPIPKPGKPPTTLQALRPVSLTPTICKIYEKLIATRLS